MAAVLDQQLVGTAAGFQQVSMMLESGDDWALNGTVPTRRMSFAPRARGVSLLDEDVSFPGDALDVEQLFFARSFHEEDGGSITGSLSDIASEESNDEVDVTSFLTPLKRPSIQEMGVHQFVQPAHTRRQSLSQQQQPPLVNTAQRNSVSQSHDQSARRLSAYEPVPLVGTAPSSLVPTATVPTVGAAPSLPLRNSTSGVPTVQSSFSYPSTVGSHTDADLPFAPSLTPAGHMLTTASGQPVKTGANYIGRYSPEERKKRLRRFHEKRLQRKWGKRIKYQDRKVQAENQHRVRGRFAKLPPEVVLARRQAKEAERAAKAEAKRLAKQAKLAAQANAKGRGKATASSGSAATSSGYKGAKVNGGNGTKSQFLAR